MKTELACMLALTLFGTSTVAFAQPKMCPHLVSPVCAVSKDAKRTIFNNSCEAEGAGAKVLHSGACEGGDVCSTIYAPVCATDPATAREKTYSSSCVAEHENAAYVHDGECKS
jgi:hypothetical protein